MIPIILIQTIKLPPDFLYPPAALYRKKWYFPILLFTARQVGVHITLFVVLFFGNFGGQNQQSLSPLQGTEGSLCIFPRHQPYHFLCRGGIHAARPPFP